MSCEFRARSRWGAPSRQLRMSASSKTRFAFSRWSGGRSVSARRSSKFGRQAIRANAASASRRVHVALMAFSAARGLGTGLAREQSIASKKQAQVLFGQ